MCVSFALSVILYYHVKNGILVMKEGGHLNMENVNTNNGIGIKQAVATAYDFLQDIYEEQNISDVMLEEIDSSHDDKYWLVTLGFNREQPSVTPLQALSLQKNMGRVYKVIKVDKKKGKSVSMHIREV
jgi:hypothetical protein